MKSREVERRFVVFGYTVLRSGRRLFACREFLDHEKEAAEINLGETDEVMRIDGEEQREIVEVEFNERKERGTNQGLGISGEEHGDIKLGELRGTVFVNRDHDDGTKKFRAVYTRKRRRTVESNSLFECGSFKEKYGLNKMYEKTYSRKKARTSLGFRNSSSDLGFDGKDVLRKGPVVIVSPCSYTSEDNSSCIYRFSCFVSSVLRYMRNPNVFSWRQFSPFLLSEPTTTIYSSIGIRFPKDSTCKTSHGFFNVFGLVQSIPFFTVDFNALPFSFLYMHSSSLLKSAFESYALIAHPVVENVAYDGIKVPYFLSTDRDQPSGYFVAAIKARSARKRVLRVSVFKESFPVHVENILPVPGVREVSGYTEEEYVPFMLPESYIRFRDGELTRSLDKSYPIYDMDLLDEEWLKKFNNEHFVHNKRVSEDTFEKIIGALEKGMYCNRAIYTDATSAVDRCLELGLSASKEVLKAVHGYWIKKRKKKCSPLARVFKCYPHKRGRKPFKKSVVRKKRSFRGRNSQCSAGKQPDAMEAIKNNQNLLEEARKAQVNAHETQEAAVRAEAAALNKWQQAQALMKDADVAVHRATMLLRIAELRAAAHKKSNATAGSAHEKTTDAAAHNKRTIATVHEKTTPAAAVEKTTDTAAHNKTSNGTGGLRGKGPRPTCVLALPCVRAQAGGRAP